MLDYIVRLCQSSIIEKKEKCSWNSIISIGLLGGLGEKRGGVTTRSDQLGHWIDIKHQLWSCCEGEKKPHRTIVSQLKTQNIWGDVMTRTNTTRVNHFVPQNMKSINLPVKTKIALSESRSSNSSFPLLVTGWLVLLLTLNFAFWSSFLLQKAAGSGIHTHQLHLRQYHYHYQGNQIKGPNKDLVDLESNSFL